MSENFVFEPSRQLPIPAFPASDDRQYGSRAAGILRNAARDVALAPSIEAKLIAFSEVAATLGMAVSDLWLPKNIVVHRLNQIADAHGRFGLGNDQIEGIVSEAIARTDLRFKALAESDPTVNVEWSGQLAVLPITSTLPPVEPFIPELLPDAIRDYVTDVADRQQAPPDFAAVTALCGLASVIGNRVRIRPKQNDDWEVVPNLWGAIIGRPSAMKSPAMKAALAPIYAIEEDLRERWAEEIKTTEIDDVLSSFDVKGAKKKAQAALEDGDRDGARRILAGLVDDEKEPPCPRIVVNDTTVEKLGELLNENPRGLLLIRDELAGFLARLESEEHQGERAFYLEAYNGDGRFTYDRIGRGTIHIENCTISIIGGIQPSRIAPIVRGALSGTSNDGLIQRLQMTVWPDDGRSSWRWVDRKPDTKVFF